MGLSLAAIHLIAPLLGDFEGRRSQKLLTLGVQDCHFRYEELISLLERHALPSRPLADQASDVVGSLRLRHHVRE